MGEPLTILFGAAVGAALPLWMWWRTLGALAVQRRLVAQARQLIVAHERRHALDAERIRNLMGYLAGDRSAIQ